MENVEILNDISKTLCGWIAPDGKVYGINSYREIDDHIRIAKEIIKDLPNITMQQWANPEYVLEKNGYVKYCVYSALSIAPIGKVTEAQRTALVRFMEANSLCSLQLGWSGLYSIGQIRGCDLLSFAKLLTE